MKLDVTLDRSVFLRMTTAQVNAIDDYVQTRTGLIQTRTSAMRDALWLGLAVLKQQAAVEAKAARARAGEGI